MTGVTPDSPVAERAAFVRERLPGAGLFADKQWRVSPEPLFLPRKSRKVFEDLGRILLKFYQGLDLLYRQSHSGKQPEFPSRWMDLGKPEDLLEWQSSPGFKGEVPRVIRPDILLTDEGMAITELDSVPGGIGLTAWLNQTYAAMGYDVVGGEEGMVTGFESVFPPQSEVAIAISQEAGDYRPESQWLVDRLNQRQGRFRVVDAEGPLPDEVSSVYRFFELFDLENLPGARGLLDRGAAGEITVTAPPKSYFEEKLMFALYWNPRLREFWRTALGGGFLRKLDQWIPMTWILDPTPIPPHAAIAGLNLGSWEELKGLSQKERRLILKISGYSEEAWGSRGVFLGSDLPADEWAAAVDRALGSFEKNPYILQRFAKSMVLDAAWFDQAASSVQPFRSRARLCPYYFVQGEREQARAKLGGILATLCPEDKKIIHGMEDAALVPVVFEDRESS